MNICIFSASGFPVIIKFQPATCKKYLPLLEGFLTATTSVGETNPAVSCTHLNPQNAASTELQELVGSN